MSNLLETLLGPPISEFSNDHLPTLRDVLQFYSQYWGSHGSESQRENLVAKGLIKVYNRSNIPVLSEKGVRNKIHRNVDKMKTILKKFQAKVKTAANIERENFFRAALEEVFEIRQSITASMNQEEASSATSNTNIEVDGIIFFYFLTNICTLQSSCFNRK